MRYKPALEAWRPNLYFNSPPRAQFQSFRNLIPLGCVGNQKPPTYSFLPYVRSRHPLFTQFSTFPELAALAGDKYYQSRPTISNISKAILTLEKRPHFDPLVLQSESFMFATKYFMEQYGHLYKDGVASFEETVEYIDYSKSPGKTGTFSGLKSKKDLANDNDFREWFLSKKHLGRPALWSASGKIEFKEKEDLENDKIRLFKIPPFELLFEQIKFGKRASERFKNFKWSAFGFNPYSGGCNRMALALLKNNLRFFYDLRGWDKYIPILSEYYHVVSSCSDIHKSEYNAFRWVILNTVNCQFVDPFGNVFLQSYGNPSGSGTTTRDNIGMHIMLVTAMLYEAFFSKYGRSPPRDLLNQQVIFIFGDDIIGSLTEEFEVLETPMFVENFFKKYGMETKYCTVQKYLPLTECNFLGFTFHLINGVYYPLYDITKLATSMVYQSTSSHTDLAFVSRAFTLFIMSYPHRSFELFRKAWMQICDYFSKSDDPGICSYIAFRNVPDYEIIQFYQGVETSQVFDFFDLSLVNLIFQESGDNVGFIYNTLFQQNEYNKSCDRIYEHGSGTIRRDDVLC